MTTPVLSKNKSVILSPDDSFLEFQNLCKNLSSNKSNLMTQNLMEIQPLTLDFKKNYESLPKNRWFFIQANQNAFFSPRTGHAVCLLGDDIYLFGGIDNKEVKKKIKNYLKFFFRRKKMIFLNIQS